VIGKSYKAAHPKPGFKESQTEKAISRKPPFSRQEKKKKEKGKRDDRQRQFGSRGPCIRHKGQLTSLLTRVEDRKNKKKKGGRWGGG